MRVFVAAWLDDSTRKQLERLELGSVPGIRLVEPRQWHITLRFLGNVGDDLVPPLTDALVDAARSVSGPVHCTVGPGTAWFANQRVLQIPVTGLDEVAEAVRSATIPIVPTGGIGEPAFTGHLTIARTSGGHLNRSSRSALAGIPFSATIDIESFDLVASEASGGGRRYRTLAQVRF